MTHGASGTGTSEPALGTECIRGGGGACAYLLPASDEPDGGVAVSFRDNASFMLVSPPAPPASTRASVPEPAVQRAAETPGTESVLGLSRRTMRSQPAQAQPSTACTKPPAHARPGATACHTRTHAHTHTHTHTHNLHARAHTICTRTRTHTHTLHTHTIHTLTGRNGPIHCPPFPPAPLRGLPRKQKQKKGKPRIAHSKEVIRKSALGQS